VWRDVTSPDGLPTLSGHRGGRGEPLVLIHGVGSFWGVWRPVLGALERRYEVIAVDLPGYGTSAPLPAGETPSVPALARTVAAELDRLGFVTAHLAGNSMGGWIALELARMGRARDVVALSPLGRLTLGERLYGQASLRLSRLATIAVAPFADRLMRSRLARLGLSQMFGRPRRIPPEDAAEAIRMYARAPSFWATVNWTWGHAPEGLDQIRCPVLIAWGTRDRLLWPRQARRFGEAIPGAEVRMLPGLGHAPMSDDPDLIAATILGFIGR
jgi:pimeloyl-ACP methyl ester carboxylesterase